MNDITLLSIFFIIMLVPPLLVYVTVILYELFARNRYKGEPLRSRIAKILQEDVRDTEVHPYVDKIHEEMVARAFKRRNKNVIVPRKVDKYNLDQEAGYQPPIEPRYS